MHTEQNDSSWPAEMTIRLVSNPFNLVDMLWIRHQAIPHAAPHLPPAVLPDRHTPSDVPDLALEWAELWDRMLDHIERSQQTPAETLALRTDLWEAPRADSLANELGLSLDRAGEWRMSLDSAGNAEEHVTNQLQDAWNKGLTSIIELPLRRDYFVMVSPSTALVSATTRASTELYGSALARVR